MVEPSYEVLTSLYGDFPAEILRGLFEAQGIPVVLSQEGVGRYAYAVNVGPLGKVDLLVPRELLAEARKVLDAYEAGAFAANDEQDIGYPEELPYEEDQD